MLQHNNLYVSLLLLCLLPTFNFIFNCLKIYWIWCWRIWKVIAPISGVKVDWFQDLETLEMNKTLITINFDYFWVGKCNINYVNDVIFSPMTWKNDFSFQVNLWLWLSWGCGKNTVAICHKLFNWCNVSLNSPLVECLSLHFKPIFQANSLWSSAIYFPFGS